jgi:glycosyltransferase involved in cell wall biosynthesis
LKEKYRGWDIRTSWLQVIYNFIPKFPYLLPFIPLAISSLDFSGYDIVLSSSSGFAKNIKVPKNCVHINYCHTPTRFLWQDENYLRQEVPKFLLPLARLVLRGMKKWDFKGAQRVSYFIANSKEVQKRIQLYYQRTSTLIHAGVNTEFWKPTVPKSDYFLIAGRLQAHKYNDFIVEIFNELGLPLHVAGTGRQEKYLKSMAKPNITFLGKISDEQLRDEYSAATGYIYPQIEDFGLMPLEAAACGTATLAYAKGGALETVLPGVTGEFFKDYGKDKIKQMILNWQPEKYRTDNLRSQAEKFSKEKFKNNINMVIKDFARLPHSRP